MTASIYETLGEDTVQRMDRFALLIGVKLEDMPAFAAGRNATGMVFSDREVPADLSQVLEIVHNEAQSTPFSYHLDRPEFALAAVITAFAILNRRA